MLFPQPPAPTQIVLESSGFSSKILNGLALLRQGGELCDYTLVAENQEFLVRLYFINSFGTSFIEKFLVKENGKG